MIVRWRFATLLALAATNACASGMSAPTGRPRPLPPDSAAMLAAALPMVRPAFQTQEEAIAARHYAGVPSMLSAAPAATSEPRTALASTYFIQVAAYRDLLHAEDAAELARRRFPDLEVRVEEAPDLVRVSVGGWSSSSGAHSMLGTVRSYYPDAWIRSRASP